MLSPVKIKSKINAGIQPVYDIQVADAHHYILDNGIISHNSGFIFAASIVVAMKPLKLKEDAEGVKGTEVLGIRAGCKIMKTRYNKPFETMEVKIPYSTGMNAHSGLFELFEQQQLLVKEGNRYVYTDQSGVQHKHWHKEYLTNADGILDLIMKEFDFELVPVPAQDQIVEEEA